jgi:hypothetical protein
MRKTENTTPKAEWAKAKGTCGFSVAGPVFGNFVNGVALFCWRNDYKVHETGEQVERWTCVVTGHLSCSGYSQAEAQQAGAKYARTYGVLGSDRRLSRATFDAKMAEKPVVPKAAEGGLT